MRTGRTACRPRPRSLGSVLLTFTRPRPPFRSSFTCRLASFLRRSSSSTKKKSLCIQSTVLVLGVDSPQIARVVLSPVKVKNTYELLCKNHHSSLCKSHSQPYICTVLSWHAYKKKKKKVTLHKFLLWFDRLIFFCYRSTVLPHILDAEDRVFITSTFFGLGSKSKGLPKKRRFISIRVLIWAPNSRGA